MQQYLPLITGSGGALAVMALGLWLFLTGKIHSDSEFSKMETERDYWRDAYGQQAQASQIDRRVVYETAQAGQVNNQLLTAIVNLASGRKPAPRQPPPPGLTAEDLGLTQ